MKKLTGGRMMSPFLITENERTSLRKLADALANVRGVLKVVLFGSRARGDFHGSSDMDLLVILSHMNIGVKNEVIHLLHNIELEYDVPISPVIFTRKEYEANERLRSSFIEHIEREGIILYDAEQKRENRSVTV